MLGNLVVGLIVAAIIIAASYSVYKSRKQGKCCGCDGNCPSFSKCRKADSSGE